MNFLVLLGRFFQVFVLLCGVLVLCMAGANPFVAGQITGRLLMTLFMTEVCIRFCRPRQDEGLSGCNLLAGGCLTFLVLGGVGGFIIGASKGFAGAKRQELAPHSGPNRAFSYKAPKGAIFKTQSRTDETPQGKIKVNGEYWDQGDEGGASGVADIPILRASAPSTSRTGMGYSYTQNQGLGRALSNDEILDAVIESQVQAMGATRGSSRVVNKLGYRGREVDIAQKEKKMTGRVIYLWGGSRLYFCMYASTENHWDEARCNSVLNSFHISLR
ncbi:MAG: hypothetical protein U0931_38775 [Vulcanimicrobiota bacterium]